MRRSTPCPGLLNYTHLLSSTHTQTCVLNLEVGLGGSWTSPSCLPLPEVETLNFLCFSLFLISLAGVLEAVRTQLLSLKTPETFFWGQ